jgi:hypothetical protein
MSTATVATRTATKLALTHVLDNVIQHSKISSAFKKSGYDKINDLFQLNDFDISKLEYDVTENNTTTTHSLQKGDMGMTRSFIHYVHQVLVVYSMTPLVMTGYQSRQKR